MKEWRRILEGLGWLIIPGILVSGLTLSLFKCIGILDNCWNPEPTIATYLLSAMAQVIATVSVLSVAVMQIVSGTGRISVDDLVRQGEFKVTVGVSAEGVLFPLFVLYSNYFCMTTIIALAYGTGNLFVVGWYIWRMAVVQGRIAKLRNLKKEIKEILEGAYQIVKEERASKSTQEQDEKVRIRKIRIQEAIDKMREAKIQGLESIKKSEPLVAQEAALTIHSSVLSVRGIEGFDEIWDKATRMLIELDTQAYDKKMKKLNYNTSSYIASFVVRYARINTDDWELIRRHFFGQFRKALMNKRVKLENAQSHTEIDYLSAMSSLLIAASAAKEYEKWRDVQNACVYSFVDAMRNPNLRKYYPPEKVFALIFHIVTDGLFIFKKSKDQLSIQSRVTDMQNLAKAAGYPTAVQLLEKAEPIIRELKYKVKSTDWVLKEQPEWINNQLSVFKFSGRT